MREIIRVNFATNFMLSYYGAGKGIVRQHISRMAGA